MEKQIQMRAIAPANGGLRVREAAEGEAKSRTIEGFAIVFGKPSVVLNDWWDGPFREYVDDGAIEQSMLDGCDIKMTAFHNREILLARHWPDGTGTLKVEVKQGEGVFVSFDAPDSPWGDNVLEAVRRGDMRGMSFSFGQNSYTFEDKEGADGIIERHIRHFSEIREMTIAEDPAYPDTTAEARERERIEAEKKAKRDAEARERIEAEKRAKETIADLRAMAKYI